MKTQNEEMRALKEALDTILGKEYKFKADWFDTTLTELKINIENSIKTGQITALLEMTAHYNMRLEISRSGAGLRIKLTSIKYNPNE